MLYVVVVVNFEKYILGILGGHLLDCTHVFVDEFEPVAAVIAAAVVVDREELVALLV